MLFLGLADIWCAFSIPRDPKSFAVSGQNLAEASRLLLVRFPILVGFFQGQEAKNGQET